MRVRGERPSPFIWHSIEKKKKKIGKKTIIARETSEIMTYKYEKKLRAYQKRVTMNRHRKKKTEHENV